MCGLVIKHLFLLREGKKHTRGNTTLRQVLENIAELLHLPNYNSDDIYSLHHLDGDHDNNRLCNLALMERSKHTSYHSKLSRRGLNINSKEAIDLFNREYLEYCVLVGDSLERMIDLLAKHEADQADREA